MKVSKMIERLASLQSVLGDVDVLITDGYNASCCKGQYEIAPWVDDDGKSCIDIGIGGCWE